MALSYRTRGIIFKKTDSGDTDRIFAFFTEDFGKLEILAKAERKISSKLRGGLEIFYLSDIEFIQGKTHKTLTEAFLIESFKNIRRDLIKLRVAYKIAEVLDALLKGEEKDRDIWNLLLETFQKLEGLTATRTKKIKVSAQIVFYYFLWNFLSILGYQPEIHSCSICQKKIKPEKLYFSFKEGGVVCGSCSEKLKEKKSIDENLIKILRVILRKDWLFLNRLKIEESDWRLLEEVSEGYLSSVYEKFDYSIVK
jgi:DNA repair protein RecO (recombination protein O)